MCHFSKEGQCKFGLIQTFALNPNPVAIVKVFEHSNSSLMKRLGPSCRDVLEEYKEIDFISTFIHEIKCPEEHSRLEVILCLTMCLNSQISLITTNTLYHLLLIVSRHNIKQQWCMISLWYAQR